MHAEKSVHTNVDVGDSKIVCRERTRVGGHMDRCTIAAFVRSDSVAARN